MPSSDSNRLTGSPDDAGRSFVMGRVWASRSASRHFLQSPDAGSRPATWTVAAAGQARWSTAPLPRSGARAEGDPSSGLAPGAGDRPPGRRDPAPGRLLPGAGRRAQHLPPPHCRRSDPTGGALVQLLEGTAAHESSSEFPRLPRPFRLGPLEGHECGEAYNVRFSAAGRAFGLRVGRRHRPQRIGAPAARGPGREPAC